MKNLIFLLSLIISYSISKADILPGRTIDYCIKIQNADSFPGVSFFLVVKPIDNSQISITEIKSTDCLDKGYKFNSSDIYAINSDYIISKNIKTIDYKNDKHVYVSNISIPAVSSQIITDNNSINKIEEYYRILGFREGLIILYLHKRITIYSEDEDNLIETFAAPEFANVKNTIEPIDIAPVEIRGNLIISPSSSQEYLNVYLLNQYLGDVLIDIYSISGQKMCSNHLIKNKEELKGTISIKNFPRGFYNVKFIIGKVSISKLFLKK